MKEASSKPRLVNIDGRDVDLNLLDTESKKLLSKIVLVQSLVRQKELEIEIMKASLVEMQEKITLAAKAL